MALFHAEVLSDSLGMHTTISIILPEHRYGDQPNEERPVLYLLHGYSDDASVWLRRTSIERYAEDRGVIVVLPSVGLSFYQNLENDCQYWTWVSEELPLMVSHLFRVTSSPQKTFVAGLSMGGYGAFLLALRQPERFASAASLSGVLDIVAYRKDPDPLVGKLVNRVFGPVGKLKGSESDLVHLVAQHSAAGTPLPRLYAWCGSEDFLLPSNLALVEAAKRQGVPLEYRQSSGDHTWVHWDREIERYLTWLEEQGLLARHKD